MMHNEVEIEVSDDLGDVWHVGYEPDVWAWVPWRYADDEGLFGGRWDDQRGQFRTIYTADSLLGCLLELLARFRPNLALLAALDDVDDDDDSVGQFHEAPSGVVGHSWLDAALLKDAHDRVLTRSIARWLYDLHDDDGPSVDGVRFQSRHGDEIHVWAVFERADDRAQSQRLRATREPTRLHPDLPALQQAFSRFRLRWAED